MLRRQLGINQTELARRLGVRDWCDENGYGALAALNADAVLGYIVALRSRGWAAATMAIHIRNLRTFLSWLWCKQLLADNLASEIHPPRAAPRLSDLPTSEEIAALLASCNPDEPLGAGQSDHVGAFGHGHASWGTGHISMLGCSRRRGYNLAAYLCAQNALLALCFSGRFDYLGSQGVYGDQA